MKTPYGWVWIWGEMPRSDPDPALTDEPWLSQDIYLIATPDNRWQLDIGYRPDGNPAGTFAIRLIYEDRWQSPVWFYQTPKFANIRQTIRPMLHYVDAHPGGPEWLE